MSIDNNVDQSSLLVEFIPSQKKNSNSVNYVALYQGYVYHKDNHQKANLDKLKYRCSQRTRSGCKARLIAKESGEITFIYSVHNHEPNLDYIKRRKSVLSSNKCTNQESPNSNNRLIDELITDGIYYQQDLNSGNHSSNSSLTSPLASGVVENQLQIPITYSFLNDNQFIDSSVHTTFNQLNFDIEFDQNTSSSDSTENSGIPVAEFIPSEEFEPSDILAQISRMVGSQVTKKNSKENAQVVRKRGRPRKNDSTKPMKKPKRSYIKRKNQPPQLVSNTAPRENTVEISDGGTEVGNDTSTSSSASSTPQHPIEAIQELLNKFHDIRNNVEATINQLTAIKTAVNDNPNIMGDNFDLSTLNQLLIFRQPKSEIGE